MGKKQGLVGYFVIGIKDFIAALVAGIVTGILSLIVFSIIGMLFSDASLGGVPLAGLSAGESIGLLLGGTPLILYLPAVIIIKGFVNNKLWGWS